MKHHEAKPTGAGKNSFKLIDSARFLKGEPSAWILFFVLLTFCDQNLFYDPNPIFFLGCGPYFEMSAYHFLNEFRHYLAF